ncbi:MULTISPECIES: toprim domain-containing protein [Acidithiobacillus]|uniref:Toprim domain-containing protein n=2 Tax=Acidithiobacillus TaxID=119977 RepID=A0A179BPH9_ACIFR|nr:MULTISPECIES: toprim domain-containing protein [Acidithiobacillus]MEB8487441.1 toprim domain-containing protein [Acidithiobacillus ferriphilus]MEB8491416.1 toprim domain-containing protein [Acidithiobacillus ferriphilus]MEB8493256.1 toprim domain-containing protein [Acidithiobacillus ferriphilus]MEB8514854.1 toprim domain-containing protein [Acidithiobacillus ferriphilus]MEB8521001.1 toprim domain-containing protein [Acidithiobacillus ferriphilus]
MERDLFAEAKVLDLVAFLENYLGNGKKEGKSYRFTACPQCGQSSAKSEKLSVTAGNSGTQHYRCYRCGAAGTIIDAAMAIWGVHEPLEAAKILLGENAPRAVVIKRSDSKPAEPANDPQAMTAAITRIRQVTANQNIDDPRWRKAVAYLVEERCIPKAVVQEAMKRLILGFIPDDVSNAAQFLERSVGREILEASGLWKPGKKIPGISFRPIVSFFPKLTSAEFRIARSPVEGEKKAMRYGVGSYPWFWRGSNPAATMLVEGAIDIMSAVALGYEGNILGLPGANSWQPEMLEAYQMKNPQTQVYHICTDNDVNQKDNPGRMWAIKLKGIIEKNLRKRADITLPESGDLNDALRRRNKT